MALSLKGRCHFDATNNAASANYQKLKVELFSYATSFIDTNGRLVTNRRAILSAELSAILQINAFALCVRTQSLDLYQK